MEWLGKAKINFIHSTSPIELQYQNSQRTDLLHICEQSVPPCNLNPLLFNGHAQTCWAATEHEAPPIYFKRKIFQSNDEKYRGSFAVDFVVSPFTGVDNTLPERTILYHDDEPIDSDDTKPQLIILHGLTGGSHETYVRHCIAPLSEDENWDICVINSRGCAQSKLTSGVLYNGRATWDIRQVVQWYQKNFPKKLLFGLGFSLGANILTNYCGEEGGNCPLKAAIVCSNPFNLEVTSRALLRTFVGRNLYLRAMGGAVRDFWRNNEKEMRTYTNIEYDRIMRITTLTEFDREVHCKTWGYPTVFTYYRDASSSNSVLAIRIPFLALHATDDPIAVEEALPYDEFQQNPYTVLCTTSLGGHLCWFESGGGRWYTKPVTNFLNSMAFEIKNVYGNRASEQDCIRSFDPMRRAMNECR
ncbi:unnamed protein product [Clonostachys rosea]|uniref:AB hydrolase-1 domain-containing protein n=1 Tax=Bionectria ochroleuca TaxID=29856 RepID=A0ABY6V541_BIOOC|nr:unnamed protein product [Clonostachys rosea]